MGGQRGAAQLALSLAALLLASGASCYPYRQLLADNSADPAAADPADQPLYSMVRSQGFLSWQRPIRTFIGIRALQEAAVRRQRTVNQQWGDRTLFVLAVCRIAASTQALGVVCGLHLTIVSI